MHFRSGQGSLIAVGTGIRVVGQLTTEAIAWMKRADRLLYSVSDVLAEETIRELNPAGAESLTVFYAENKPRGVTYQQMVERTLQCVRSGMLTCVALYGHPGVFAYPVHEAIRQARVEGYPARMLPGISSDACLFADLGVDPATAGCQSYEATDFLLYGRTVDPSAALILWQVGTVGDILYHHGAYDRSLLPVLVERLCRFYPADHVCTLYEAAVLPDGEPEIRKVPIGLLHQVPVPWATTVYIPPAQVRGPDLDILAQDRGGSGRRAAGRAGSECRAHRDGLSGTV